MAPNSALSARDVEVLAAAFQSLKTPPEIDYEKLAEKANYKNASSARACFQEVKKKLRIAAGNDTAAPTSNKKASNPRKRKQLSSPPSSSSATLGSSSPPPNSDDETSTRPLKELKTKAKSTASSRAKKPIISTPETEEDINNAKAIAAGRARYAADKLAAEMKKEDGEEHPVDDAAEGEDEEPLGMNIDSGEDEGLTAYELVKQEVFGEGVEF